MVRASGHIVSQRRRQIAKLISGLNFKKFQAEKNKITRPIKLPAAIEATIHNKPRSLITASQMPKSIRPLEQISAAATLAIAKFFWKMLMKIDWREMNRKEKLAIEIPSLINSG